MTFGWIARDPRSPTAEAIARMAASLRSGPRQRLDTFVGPGIAVGILEPPARPGDSESLAPASMGGVRLWLAGEAFVSGDHRLHLEDAADSRSPGFRRRLLARWLEAGPDAIARLDGEYHVVLWNRAERTLTVCTDRFGGLPLYVGESPEGWAFAGGVRGVLAAGIDQGADPEALREAVTFGGFRLGDRTNVRAVRMVGGATVLRFTPGGRTERRYWTYGDIQPVAGVGASAAIEQLQSLWRAAIARRTVDAGRYGQTLSGGLDSRAILAEAAPRTRWTAITYGVPGCDDARYARRAAEAAGARWIFQPLYTGDWLEARTSWIQQTDGLIELGDLMHLESTRLQRSLFDVHLSGYIGDAVSGPTFASIESLHDAVVAMPYYGTAVSLDFTEACARVGARLDPRAPVRFVVFENKLPQSTNRWTAAWRPWLRVRKPFVDYAFFDYCQGLPVALRTQGRLHERWLRRSYPRCFRSIPNQRTGYPALTPGWRVQIGRVGRRARALARRVLPPPLRPQLRPRSYHDNDRMWRTAPALEQILATIARRDALCHDILGRARVEAVLDGWRRSAAAPSQVIGALYVYEMYHAGLGHHLAAARAAAVAAPAADEEES